ncbi:MAG TPA: ABC transporter permease [Steroidobacteraceae bacterium]
MISIRQAAVLSVWGLRSLPARFGAPLTTIVSMTCAVMVFVALLSMGEGLHTWATQGTRPDRVLLLSRGAPIPDLSMVSREVLASVASDPGIKEDSQGHALVAAIATISLYVQTRANKGGSVEVLGTTSPDVYPEIHVLRGRWPRAGLHELLASSESERLDKGLDIGDRVLIRGAPWIIVGAFASTGSYFDQVLFTDADTLLSAIGLSTYNEIVAILKSAGQFSQFSDRIQHEPTLMLDAYQEARLREETFSATRHFLNFVSYFIGAILAAAAACAAANSCYAAVGARRRELGTLRAIGFGTPSIAASIVVEGVLISLLGACLGYLVTWEILNGRLIATRGLTFPLAIGVREFAISATWAICIAVVASAPPVARASRFLGSGSVA